MDGAVRRHRGPLKRRPRERLDAVPPPIYAHHMQAVGYVRVSTERQADQGVSLAAQMEKVKAMATVQGLKLLDVIVDGGESAKSMRRPGMQRILKLTEEKAIKAVIVAKLDRLT